MPLIDVVFDAGTHATCLHARFTQLLPPVTPHKLGPPPPQNAGAVHAPQSAVRPPQPSEILPHVPAGAVAHVLGTHETPPPQTLGVPPPPQNAGGAHAPQLAVRPPQPSESVPHFPGKSAHVFGVQGGAPPPHTLATPPPPHVAGGVQVPQLGVRPPQPSGCGPHVPG